MISKHLARYQLEFCYPHDYAAFVKAVKYKRSIPRVGFIGIEHLRMFVSVERGRVCLEPYERLDRSWSPYRHPVKLVTPDVTRMCHSSQEYEEELAEAFFRAFPHAEEAFYENMPPYKEVLAQLQGDPTSEKIESLRLVCITDDAETIDDADGYVSITCEDGVLCIPFDYSSGSKKLQMYRAKFHPDAVAVHVFHGFFDWVDSIVSRLSSITLDSVLGRIDKIIK